MVAGWAPDIDVDEAIADTSDVDVDVDGEDVDGEDVDVDEEGVDVEGVDVDVDAVAEQPTSSIRQHTVRNSCFTTAV
ncbi:MAG: hypothetical protein LH616_05065 [Ilumatobacteraceae bacterium]|nr:hypothetical protein [Ilumatobacteraceae bacterium]